VEAEAAEVGVAAGAEVVAAKAEVEEAVVEAGRPRS